MPFLATSPGSSPAQSAPVSRSSANRWSAAFIAPGSHDVPSSATRRRSAAAGRFSSRNTGRRLLKHEQHALRGRDRARTPARWRVARGGRHLHVNQVARQPRAWCAAVRFAVCPGPERVEPSGRTGSSMHWQGSSCDNLRPVCDPVWAKKRPQQRAFLASGQGITSRLLLSWQQAWLQPWLSLAASFSSLGLLGGGSLFFLRLLGGGSFFFLGLLWLPPWHLPWLLLLGRCSSGGRSGSRCGGSSSFGGSSSLGRGASDKETSNQGGEQLVHVQFP